MCEQMSRQRTGRTSKSRHWLIQDAHTQKLTNSWSKIREFRQNRSTSHLKFLMQMDQIMER